MRKSSRCAVKTNLCDAEYRKRRYELNMVVIRAHGERAASGCDRLDRHTDYFTREDGAHTPMSTRTERQAKTRGPIESELVRDEESATRPDSQRES